MIVTLKDVHVSPVNPRDVVLTVEHHPGWLARLFGASTTAVQYVGFSTVWRRVPDMHRMPTYFEIMLGELHERWKWRKAAK